MSIGVVGCSSDSDDSSPPPEGTVDVTLSDFKIELSDTSTPAGTVTFKFDNKGPSVHEFVVFETDLAPDALPTDDAGDVAETDTFAPVDEREDIGVGKSADDLAIDLTAGKYVVICNVPAHYRQGMRAAFTVT
jgi:uncharacterized cupredoxin-like copper-binding protein